MILSVEHLTKTVKKTNVVDDISFSIKENCVFGLIGANGAGKTTTLGMLSTLIKPTKGDAILCGHSITKKPNEIKKIIGALPHETCFYMNRTPIENLVFYGRLSGLSRTTAFSRGLEILERVGMKANLHKKIDELSNGMKKQLGIAQAIIHEPKLLMLDEPFSGLDPQSKINLRKIITSLKDKMTIIISSHELDVVDKLCSRIALLKKGKIVFEDTVNNLKLNTNQVSIRLSELTDNILKILKKIKNVSKFSVSENTVSIIFKGKADKLDMVSKLLTKNKIKALSITRGASMEDLFVENSNA